MLQCPLQCNSRRRKVELVLIRLLPLLFPQNVGASPLSPPNPSSKNLSLNLMKPFKNISGEEPESGLRVYLREIGRVALLTPKQEIELAARIQLGDREARALMINANLRLVVKIAHDYSNFGLPMPDLISEGNIGLIKAVERFDPAKGGKLSTYAAWWIKQSIKRALANQSKTIRLPVHLVDKIAKIRRLSQGMSEELGREPTDEELAEEVGISAPKLAQLRIISLRPASLDAPVSDEDGKELGETVGDLEAPNPLEQLQDSNLLDELGEVLEELDPRERKIISSRFGLGGDPPRTLEEVGKRFGVTRERIRQLQNGALAKLKRALARRDRPIEALLPGDIGVLLASRRKEDARCSRPDG